MGTSLLADASVERSTGSENSWAHHARVALIADLPLFVYVLVFVACGAGVAYYLDVYFNIGIFIRLINLAIILIPTYTLLIFLWRAREIAASMRPHSPGEAIKADIKKLVTDRRRVCHCINAMVALAMLMGTFGFIKDQIPVIRPFDWDVTFMEWDRALHFGYLPHDLLQPVLGYPVITWVIDFAYKVWFQTKFFMFFTLACTMTLPQLRLQFLLSFAMAWSIGGSLLACVFSSVGPVYYEKIGAGSIYEPHMAYLHKVGETFHLYALMFQDMLWRAYQGEPTLIAGISAMPSMHVTIAVLLALGGWAVNRTLGIALTIFAVLIMIGSVHLGWHYAIDGYLGAIIAVVCWIVSGWVSRRWLAFVNRTAETSTTATAPHQATV